MALNHTRKHFCTRHLCHTSSPSHIIYTVWRVVHPRVSFTPWQPQLCMSTGRGNTNDELPDCNLNTL